MTEQSKPKKPVVVQKIPEAERKPIRFYPPPRLEGAQIGQGCYWRRPQSGHGGF